MDEDSAGDIPDKMPKARKEKRTQSDFLHIYDDEAEGDLHEAITIYRDSVLDKPYEMLSHERRAKVDAAAKLFYKRGSYILAKRKKSKMSKDDPRFETTWANPADFSAFQSSQGSEVSLPEDDHDFVLASALDGPGSISSQDPDSEEMVAAQSTQAIGGRPPRSLHKLTTSVQRQNRIRQYRAEMVKWANVEGSCTCNPKLASCERCTVSVVQLCGLIIHYETWSLSHASFSLIGPVSTFFNYNSIFMDYETNFSDISLLYMN